LALSSERRDFFRMISSDSPQRAFDSVRGRMVSVLFNRRNELPNRIRKEIAAARWEVAGPDAYPLLFTLNPPRGGGVTTPVAQDLTALLQAVPALAAEFAELAASLEPPAVRLIWRHAETGVALRFEG
jgi:hypothetical protein